MSQCLAPVPLSLLDPSEPAPCQEPAPAGTGGVSHGDPAKVTAGRIMGAQEELGGEEGEVEEEEEEEEDEEDDEDSDEDKDDEEGEEGEEQEEVEEQEENEGEKEAQKGQEENDLSAAAKPIQHGDPSKITNVRVVSVSDGGGVSAGEPAHGDPSKITNVRVVSAASGGGAPTQPDTEAKHGDRNKITNVRVVGEEAPAATGTSADAGAGADTGAGLSKKERNEATLLARLDKLFLRHHKTLAMAMERERQSRSPGT